jgi:hypothetical protein
MPRSYPYAKVPRSKGTVISERFESPFVCCGYCSTQFACATAKSGISRNGRIEGHKVRALGGRKHNAGSNAGEERAGAKKALNVTLLGIKESAVLARLKAGFAVTVTVQYTKLPSYLKVQSNDFVHKVTLYGHRIAERDGRSYVGFFDPLYEQGSQGTWAKWIDLKDAMFDTGHNTTTIRR